MQAKFYRYLFLSNITSTRPRSLRENCATLKEVIKKDWLIGRQQQVEIVLIFQIQTLPRCANPILIRQKKRKHSIVVRKHDRANICLRSRNGLALSHRPVYYYNGRWANNHCRCLCARSTLTNMRLQVAFWLKMKLKSFS